LTVPEGEIDIEIDGFSLLDTEPRHPERAAPMKSRRPRTANVWRIDLKDGLDHHQSFDAMDAYGVRKRTDLPGGFP